MRVKISNVAELLGACLLLIAAAAWDWRALVAVVGLALLGVGFLLDVPEREVEA